MLKKIGLIIVSLLMLTACGAEVEDSGKIKAVTTIGMLADMVENVGGDLVEVESLMGAGVDPHLYKASAGDISSLENADVIFYVGLHLEANMVDVLEDLSLRKNVIKVSGILDESKLLGTNLTGATHDPHIWFDVDLWSETVSAVQRAFGEMDPDNSAIYRANAEAYTQKLQELDAWIESEIAQIPEEGRVLITAHDAFSYFGEAYNIDVRGLQGISTASEFGLKDLEEMINFIVQRNIKAVFVESSVPRKAIEALQQGVKAKDWDVKIGGELFSDAMGDAGTIEGTFVGMVQHNVNTIVNALK